jgi:hypothetical protein
MSSNQSAQAQATYASPVPPDSFVTSDGGVDMRAGQYLYNKTDLSIGDTQSGMGIELVRLQDNNLKGHIDRFGHFSHNWNIMVTQKNVGSSPITRQISVINAALASNFAMTSTADGATQTSDQGYANITRHDSGSSYYFTYVATDGTIVTFRNMLDACGPTLTSCAYASQVVYPNGLTYDLTYDTASSSAGDNVRLRRVVNNAGFGLVFEYNSTTTGPNFITKACAINLAVQTMPATNICPTGVPATSYTYSGNFMTSATSADGQVWTFANSFSTSTSPYTLSFFNPGETTAYLVNTITQNTPYKYVTSQAFADGRNFSYGYQLVPQGETDFTPVGTGYTDNGGNYSFTFGKYSKPSSVSDQTRYITPGPEKIIDPLNRTFLAKYTVNWPNNSCCRVTTLQTRTTPEGIVKNFTYDGRNNVVQVVTKAKTGGGLADIVESRTYTCTAAVCQAKPTTITDANGRATIYNYDSTYGTLNSETGPVDSSGIAPVKRYVYQLRKAWVSNGSGGYTQNPSGIFLLKEERICKTSATIGGGCQAGASDEVVTTYDYGPDSGPNNLLLRGTTFDATGAAPRTCNLYDNRGNKIAVTMPRGTGGTCP